MGFQKNGVLKGGKYSDTRVVQDCPLEGVKSKCWEDMRRRYTVEEIRKQERTKDF